LLAVLRGGWRRADRVSSGTSRAEEASRGGGCCPFRKKASLQEQGVIVVLAAPWTVTAAEPEEMELGLRGVDL